MIYADTGAYCLPGALDSLSSAQVSPPTLRPEPPWWLLPLLSILALGAGAQPATPDWCPDQARWLLDADFSTWLSAQRALALTPA